MELGGQIAEISIFFFKIKKAPQLRRAFLLLLYLLISIFYAHFKFLNKGRVCYGTAIWN